MNHSGIAMYTPTYKQKLKHDADFSREQKGLSENFWNLHTWWYFHCSLCKRDTVQEKSGEPRHRIPIKNNRKLRTGVTKSLHIEKNKIGLGRNYLQDDIWSTLKKDDNRISFF